MKKAERIVAIGILLAGLLLPVSGQLPNTMYFMPGVPQSNKINPAIHPGCNFYLGLPGAAPLRFQITSSSVSYSDFIYYNEELDSLITPLHPLGDKQGFLDNLMDKNFFQTEESVSLASIGFTSGKNFITLDMNMRVDATVYYPRGLFQLLFEGLPDGSTTSLGGFGADVTVFNEFGLGISRKDFLIPNLDFGVRGKVLFGLANMTTKSSVLDLETSMDEWRLSSQMDIAVSTLPILVDLENYVFDPDNPEPPTLGYEDIDFTDPVGLISDFFSGQFGLAADIGLNYKPIPQLKVSASVIDLGFINWKNTFDANFDFNYTFTGVEVNPFTGIDTVMLAELQDSVFNAFNPTPGVPYMSRLNTKLFVGVAYYPIEKIGFGLLSRTDFLNNQISQQFTGTLNMTTGKFINLSLSYSYMQRQFDNIGAGLSLNLGPFNMYLISDNLVSAGLHPLDARSVNLWFGMNLTFGWKRAAKKERPVDRPLVM